MSAWPNEALALLASVIQFEDEHPKMSACLGDALNRVPANVRAEARGRADTIREIAAWFESGQGEGIEGNRIIANRIREKFLGAKGVDA